MANTERTPAMSVVLVTPDSYATIETAMNFLRAQSVREQLEIVIVAPSAEELHAEESQLKHFHSFQVAELGNIETMGEANAAGARMARAPVVVFVEEHSYPHPGWAAALIGAQREPWAAVGPVVTNANGDSLVGWADFIVGYGPWLAPSRAGVRDFLPGHNSSYKREVLLQYGPDIDSMLESETILHADLRRRGHELYLEPAARIAHLNFEKPSVWLRAQYYSGRAFAAPRSEQWSLARRFLYIVGAPLIPFVRLKRALNEVRASKGPGVPTRWVWPVLLVGLATSAAGEMIGYALGAGDAIERRCDLEFHRVWHLNEGDSPPD